MLSLPQKKSFEEGRFMAVRIDSPNPYVGVTWGSAIKTTLLIIAAVSVFGIIGMIGVGNFYEQTENASINYYCNEAQLPSLESFIRNREIVEYLGHSNYMALETNQYKTVQEMKEALPEGYSNAVTDALENGRSEEARDTNRKTVTRYYVNKELLPLEDTRHDPDIGHYYVVLKYPDGSCRFGLLVQITDPDN